MLAYVKDCLQGVGQPPIRFLSARDGIEALKTLQTEQADLIISEVTLPHMDGFAFCRILMAENRLSHVPVLLITSESSTPDVQHRLQAVHARGLLFKPFNASRLRMAVSRLLSPADP
jgi:CheY-like chemotaxis protein